MQAPWGCLQFTDVAPHLEATPRIKGPLNNLVLWLKRNQPSNTVETMVGGECGGHRVIRRTSF